MAKKPRLNLRPKSRMDQALADQLEQGGVLGVLGDDTLECPMILGNGYNPKIISDYPVQQEVARPVVADVDTQVEIDPERVQDIYRRMDGYRKQFYDVMWEQMIPALVGFQLADEQVVGEMKTLFDGKPPVLYTPYRQALREAAFASGIRQITSIMGVSEADADLILRSKLNEYEDPAKAVRSRPAPQASRSEREPARRNRQRPDPTR